MRAKLRISFIISAILLAFSMLIWCLTIAFSKDNDPKEKSIFYFEHRLNEAAKSKAGLYFTEIDVCEDSHKLYVHEKEFEKKDYYVVNVTDAYLKSLFNKDGTFSSFNKLEKAIENNGANGKLITVFEDHQKRAWILISGGFIIAICLGFYLMLRTKKIK